jgi:uncharacterized PurR-regulated membrane protein YhhQ (DUF165 family)
MYLIKRKSFNKGVKGMKKRVLVALSSTVILSLILSLFLYTPESERRPNTLYEPFGAYVEIILFLAGLAYFLGGIPLSIYIEKIAKKTSSKLIAYIGFGYLVGALTTLIFTMLLGGPHDIFIIFYYGLYGSLGAFIFYVGMFVSNKFSY